MANYITIDGGTTNTRISLVCDYKLLETVNLDIGANKCNENIWEFKDKIKSAIKDLLKKNHLVETEIVCILASGMITSELGLYELPHKEIPVDLEILHNSSEKKIIPEISSIPFVFLRGVKKCGNGYNVDIMRGEETEMMGLMSFFETKEGVYILSGSHTKIIQVNSEGKIIDFATELTGEMISSLAKHTILHNSIDFDDAEIDKAFLIEGYEYCSKEGINSALFKVRVLDKILNKNKNQLYSFFMGIILHSELELIVRKSPVKVVLAGRKQIRDALSELIKYKSDIGVFSVSEEQVELSVPLGAIKIFEYNGV